METPLRRPKSFSGCYQPTRMRQARYLLQIDTVSMVCYMHGQIVVERMRGQRQNKSWTGCSNCTNPNSLTHSRMMLAMPRASTPGLAVQDTTRQLVEKP